MRRTLASLLATSVLCMLALPSQAVESPVILTLHGEFLPGDNDFPLTLEVAQGSSLTYHNLDLLEAHSVTSPAKSTDPHFFDSGVVAFGGSAEVKGVSKLPRGSYPFFCSPHPGMRGTLTVV